MVLRWGRAGDERMLHSASWKKRRGNTCLLYKNIFVRGRPLSVIAGRHIMELTNYLNFTIITPWIILSSLLIVKQENIPIQSNQHGKNLRTDIRKDLAHIDLFLQHICVIFYGAGNLEVLIYCFIFGLKLLCFILLLNLKL